MTALQRVTAAAEAFGERFGVALTAADGSDETKKQKAVRTAEVVLAAGRAGTQILSKSAAALGQGAAGRARRQCRAASGLAGVGAFDDGKPIEGGSAWPTVPWPSAT